MLDSLRISFSKISVVLEEADKTLFWLELLAAAGIIESRLTSSLSAECNELLMIFSALFATAKAIRLFTKSLIC